MCDFGLSSEQKLLRQNIREFAENEIAPVAQQLDETETFSIELTRKMADLGLFGIVVAEEYGGAHMDYLSYIIAVEEIARIDGSQAATVAAANSLGIGPIYYFGNEKQKKEWLPRLCRGEILASFGLTEAEAGSDAGASKTTAKLDNGRWVINGSKIFITNSTSALAGVCTVQAITGRKPDGKKEVSCILVPNGTPGFTTKKMTGKMMWRSSDTGELYFDAVVLVPLQHRAVLHAGPLRGAHLHHGPVADDHGPRVDAQVPGQVGELSGQGQHGVGRGRVAGGPVAGTGHAAPAVDLLGPGVLLARREPERLGRVAHGRAGPVGDDVGHLRGVRSSVAAVHVLDDLLTAVRLDVQVDVGQTVALGREEPLEQQPQPHGVGLGDARARSRPPSWRPSPGPGRGCRNGGRTRRCPTR